jgi:valyl-tRNA synthetase
MLTARDIVLMWFPQMIMFGLEFAGDVPFRNVYVHSIIQAPDGRRMSKSLGTGIDPIEEIEAYGSDAVRFGLLTMSTAQDVRYSRTKIEQGMRFANKLWNAGRFVNANADLGVEPAPRPRTLADRWMLSRLAAARDEFEAAIEAYEFARAASGLYDFVNNELCGAYLEFCKDRLPAEGKADAELSATLLHVLAETLSLAHPVVPFVTEETWRCVFGEEELLAGRQLGPLDERDAAADAEVGRVLAIAAAIRSWRRAAGMSASSRLDASLEAEIAPECRALVARAASLVLADNGGGPGWTEVPIPTGTLRVDAATQRAGASQGDIAERRARLEQQIDRRTAQLANQDFLANAPQHAIEAEQDRLRRQQDELAGLPG